MGNQIIQSIKTIAQSLVDKAGYDKTRGGVIVSINSATNTYSVKVDGVTYPIVRAVDGATYNVGDVVKVVIPCNQATQMYIASSVLSDNSLGNKIANAVGLAQDAAKVATNYIEQDDADGIMVGDKTSGAWSGYRSQILSDRFNILDESSTVLASFGTTTVIGEEAKANMHLTFNNLSMVDKNRAKFFEVGDSRNADGIATLQWSSLDVPIGTSGSTTITVGNTISSIVSVSVDSVELSSSSYSFSGDEVTINNLTASSEKYIEIIYKTTDPAYYLTFGSRRPSAIIGERSVAEGRYVTASGFASHAEGVGTSAIGAYSHAEGHSTEAKAAYSHAGGYQTVADSSYMTAIGTYNTENSGKAFVVGVGDFINRRDGFTVDWDGNVAVKGNLVVQGGNLVVQGDNLVDKIQNMFCTSYPETLTVTAGTFTDRGCRATLVGNNLRLYLNAKAKAAITAGNIKNQTMLTITFVDNKIGTLYSVSGSGGASGPNSQIYFDTSSSGGQHTITVTLAAIAQNLASGGIIDAYVSIPCRLKWDAY